MVHRSLPEPETRQPVPAAGPHVALPDLSQLSLSSTPSDSLLFASAGPLASEDLPQTTSPRPDDMTAAPMRRTRYVRVRGQREPVPVTVTINVNVHAPTAPVYVTNGTANTPSTPRDAHAQPYGRADGACESSHSPPTPDVSGTRNARAPPHTDDHQAQQTPGPVSTTEEGGNVIPWDPTLEYLAREDRRHRRRWYVVVAGLKVGVWKNWLEIEGYVDVEGSRYQSCATRQDALELYLQAKDAGRVRLLKK